MSAHELVTDDSLALLKAMHEHLPDGFMLLRAIRSAGGAIEDFEWVYGNAAAEGISGHGHDELLGQRLLAVWPGHRESGLFDRYVRVVETGRPESGTHHDSGDDTDRWFTVYATKVGDHVGVVFRDVTETRRLKQACEEEQARLNAFFMQAPVAICVFSPPPFTFELANPCYEQMIRRSGITGKPLLEVFPELKPDGPVVRMLQQVYETRETFTASEYVVPLDRTGDGHLEDGFFQFTCRPVVDSTDEVLALQVVAVDVTPQVRARREVEALAVRLRESEERLTAAQEAGRVGVFDWHVETGELIWTEQLERLFGLAPGTFEGTLDGWLRLVEPEDAAQITARIEETCQRGGRSLTYEYRFERGGQSRRMEGRARFDYDEAGRCIRMLGTNVDITERVRAAEALEASERQLRAIVENAGVGIAHVALDGRFVYFNERLCQLTGYPAEELRELTFQEISHPADLEENIRHLRALLAGDTSGYRMEKRYIRRDGELVWVKVTVSLVRDREGAPDYYVAIVEDVTERRRAEAALRDAARQKDEFLAVLGHELRNPLAAIRMASEVIERTEVASERLQQVQEVLRRQTSHMARLLDDLLDVSRITRGKLLMSTQPVDLAEIIRQTLGDREHPASQRGVHLTRNLPDRPVMVDGDAVRLAQVAGNLVDNAIKYTEREGRVTVRLAVEDGRAVLVVKDTGVGVDPAFQRRLFQPFQQAPQDLARSQGGLGLGLALARGITELHGGTIGVHSAGRGYGAEFTVTLPLHRGSSRQVEEETPIDSRHQRILLVEDNLDAAHLLQDLLQSLGHSVTHVATGGEAMVAARRQHPDAVICDLGLPDMSGYDVARNLREIEGMSGKRFIALSGYGQTRDRERSARAGFAEHLIKPASLDTIHRALQGDPL